MIAYLDASALLRIILREPDPYADWKTIAGRVSSELVEVECLRAIERSKQTQGLSDAEAAGCRESLYSMLESCSILKLTRPILRRAGEPFPISLGTLDALHLSTALAWQDDHDDALAMATHDRALGQAARSVGMTVIGA